MALAAFISALPAIVGFSAKEQQFLKLFLFPLVFRCLCNKAQETKLLPDIPYGSVVAYVVVCSFYGYFYGVEWYSNVPAMTKMIDSWGDFQISEKMQHASWNIHYRGLRGGYTR